MPKTDHSEISLDQLVVSLGVVSDSDIAIATQQSSKTGLPLGRTLVLSKLIDEVTLERLLRLQAIYRGCKLPWQVVVDAYGYACHEGLTVEQALAKASVDAQVVSYSRLGTLLVDAKLISKPQLDDAQKLAYQTRTALGSMLAIHGAITHAQLQLALDLQAQLRDRTITKDEALAQLSSTVQHLPTQGAATVSSEKKIAYDDETLKLQLGKADGFVSAEQRLPNKINLGELLVIAGIITDDDADAAFDRGLKNNLSLAENLVQMQVCSPALVEIALELEKHVTDGDVSLAAAVESLSYIEDYQ